MKNPITPKAVRGMYRYALDSKYMDVRHVFKGKIRIGQFHYVSKWKEWVFEPSLDCSLRPKTLGALLRAALDKDSFLNKDGAK
ncbi:MAG: hypothetical protein WCW93_03890 [Candidatus Paceibacterota bacterium]|jgi:hypothetical protein